MGKGDGSNGINIRKDKQAEGGTETDPGQWDKGTVLLSHFPTKNVGQRNRPRLLKK